jgi:hypothetical protein
MTSRTRLLLCGTLLGAITMLVIGAGPGGVSGGGSGGVGGPTNGVTATQSTNIARAVQSASNTVVQSQLQASNAAYQAQFVQKYSGSAYSLTIGSNFVVDFENFAAPYFTLQNDVIDGTNVGMRFYHAGGNVILRLDGDRLIAYDNGDGADMYSYDTGDNRFRVVGDLEIISGALQLHSAAAPTTDAAGEFGFDNNAWAASRGALQWYDGTASVFGLGVLASDTPSNGQVPKWNTGGTITWEDDTGGAGGSFAGHVNGTFSRWPVRLAQTNVVVTGTNNLTFATNASFQWHFIGTATNGQQVRASFSNYNSSAIYATNVALIYDPSVASNVTVSLIAGNSWQTLDLEYRSNELATAQWYIVGRMAKESELAVHPLLNLSTNADYVTIGVDTNKLWVRLHTNYASGASITIPCVTDVAATGTNAWAASTSITFSSLRPGTSGRLALTSDGSVRTFTILAEGATRTPMSTNWFVGTGSTNIATVASKRTIICWQVTGDANTVTNFDYWAQVAP